MLVTKRAFVGAACLALIGVAAIALVAPVALRSLGGAESARLEKQQPSGAPNVFGDLANGNCHVNANSKIQCPAVGQFPKCEQQYAFPYYYYDKMIWMSDVSLLTDDPVLMESTAFGIAQRACDSPEAYDGGETISVAQIASVFLQVNPTHAGSCAGAVIIAAGECQWSSGGSWGGSCPPGPYAGCATAPACIATVLNGIWQNGDNTQMSPAQSAANLYNDSPYSIPYLCGGAPSVVPSDYISAANTNTIGDFCHVNKFVGSRAGAFAWGGGQCSGGLGLDPPTSSCACPSSDEAAPALSVVDVLDAAAPAADDSVAGAGFFYGAAASCQPGAPPASASFPYMFSFPGGVDPVDDILPKAPPQVPSSGGYGPYVLTLGGGGTQWSDAMYEALARQMRVVKALGWDGVCFDWEYLDMSGPGTTIEGLHALLIAASAAGLQVYLTSLAEGPAQSEAGRFTLDYTSFDWDLVDFFVPQLYGADGSMPSEWQQYVDFWLHGGGTSVQAIEWSAPPLSKILWGVTATADTYSSVMAAAPGSAGYVGWCFDPYSS